MKTLLAAATLAACSFAQAQTPRQVADAYIAEATRQTPGYQPSAQRGGAFFTRKFALSEKLPSCASCHTDDPRLPGRHAVTGKTIKPLAPAADSERFTDPAKTEKWFGRNCKEVVGRECSAGEKADFVLFAMEVR
jgi:hypothetical protein